MSCGVVKADDVFELDQDDIEKLIRTMDPKIRAAFIRAVLIAKEENTLEELARLIRLGRISEIVNSVGISGAQTLADLINIIIIESGETVALSMSDFFLTNVSFDIVNNRAVNIMTDNKLRLVTEFAREQRAATQEALIDGVRRGLNPIEQARNFRSSIGLTSRQQTAVQNYRRLLTEGNADALRRELRDRRFDPTVRRAIRGESELTDAQVDKMVERYRERMLKYRSEVIARTEALRAVHEGTEEMFAQAIENGTVDPDTLVRTWLTARDVRVRDSHNDMEGQQQSFGTAFISGKGNQLRFPGDINAPADETVQCRCSLTTRVTRVAA